MPGMMEKMDITSMINMVKLQVFCVLIIVFIATVYFHAKRVKSNSHILFSISLCLTAAYLIFDISTVYSVNHLETVSSEVNRILHIFFVGTMSTELYVFYLYCGELINHKLEPKRLCLTAVPTCIAWLSMAFLPFYYAESPQGNYAAGLAVNVAKAVLAVYFLLLLESIAHRWKEINQKQRFAVVVAGCILVVVMVCQTIFPETLISSMALTLINLLCFLTVESPDILLMEKLAAEKKRADEANMAKSQFLSNMSHEIRTPMNAIVGMTDILLQGEQTPENKEYLNNIKNSGDALLTVINDILDFSKIESGKLEIVEEEYEPMSIFHDLSMIFLNRIGRKSVELLYDISPSLPEKLYGDGQRLRQVIINLMNNAIKFTDVGHVRLKVDAVPSISGWIRLSVAVEDTGMGIREEDIGKLFASFQQVDTKKNHAKEGTGLGLAICKQLVELMRGEIGVRSQYGEGSTFYFDIPQKVVKKTPAASLKDESVRQSKIGYSFKNGILTEQLRKLAETYQVECAQYREEPEEKIDFLFVENTESVSEETKRHLEKAGVHMYVLRNPMTEGAADSGFTAVNKPLYSLNFCQILNGEELTYSAQSQRELKFTAPEAQILVADDNEMNLKVAKGLMAPYEVQIDTAENGRKALEMVQKKHYDIVFMDHMMPVMDGLEATAEIRKLEGEEYQKLIIVALSANATAEAREMFLQGKMNDFIAKPIRTRELAKCILKWLPKDMVTMAEDSEPLEEAVEERARSLPRIAGLDMVEALKNCGSAQLLTELLGDFHKLIASKTAKLEKYLADGKLRDYTIEVHALKNSARMIGATELSQLFYKMEQLGNEGNKEEIEKGMPQLLKLYNSYKAVLSQYAKAPEKSETQVSVEEIKKTLMRLHDAMDTFELDAADSAMKELEAYALPEELRPMLEQLSACVADVAMEDVMRITKEMCEKLDAGM